MSMFIPKDRNSFWNDGEVLEQCNAVSETLGGSVGPTAVGSSAIVGDNVENKTIRDKKLSHIQ